MATPFAPPMSNRQCEQPHPSPSLSLSSLWSDIYMPRNCCAVPKYTWPLAWLLQADAIHIQAIPQTIHKLFLNHIPNHIHVVYFKPYSIAWLKPFKMFYSVSLGES